MCFSSLLCVLHVPTLSSGKKVQIFELLIPSFLHCRLHSMQKIPVGIRRSVSDSIYPKVSSKTDPVKNTCMLLFGRWPIQVSDGAWPILRVFVVFLSSSRQILGCCLKLYHDRFFPHPCQFTAIVTIIRRQLR